MAIFVGASAIAGTAHAQAPTDAAKTASAGKDDVARAKELFDVGAREYSSGDFDLAIQAFEQAYAISPRDGIMFSMAQAHRRQYERAGTKENLARSVALFKSYVDKVKSGGRVTDAVKALGQLEPELKKLNDTTGPTPEVTQPPVAPKKSRVVVNIYVDGTTVSIDGGPPKKPPVNEEVKPGPHRVKLSAPGFFDEERAIDVGEGEIAPANLPQRERPAELTVDTESGADISVDGRYIGEAPLSRAVELPSGRHYLVVLENGHETWEKEIDLDRGKKHVVEADLSSTTQRDLSYAVFAGAGAFAATGIVFGALAIERQTKASGLLDDRQSRALSQAELKEYEDAKKARTLYTGISIGTAGGGVALAILGTGLIVFDKPRAVAAPQVLSPGPKPSDGGTTEPSVDEPKDVEMTTSSLDIGPGYVFGSLGFSF
jgi:hypothetical protein